MRRVNSLRARFAGKWPRLLAIGAALAAVTLFSTQAAPRVFASQGFYQQTNLVSNIPGLAAVHDDNLKNAWGIVHGPNTPFWISDNGTGFSTLYNGAGTPFPPGTPLVVTIPPREGSPDGTTGTPTGVVFNSTTGFVVSNGSVSGPATFIFSTEDGTIAGWNRNVDATHAIQIKPTPATAVYKGLAIASNASGTFLYASNFHDGTVDVYNSQFQQVSLAGSFSDPNLLPDYAPFGIATIGGNLYVTFALQNAEKHDDVAGPAHGFVDVFDTNGNLIKRLVTRGRLNSPWGLALAPADFGRFSNDLLVGNFGDGRINAVDPQTGEFLGQLRDANNRAITIDGLWGLVFGGGANAGPANTLFFTAGLNDEADGLFGSFTSVGG